MKVHWSAFTITERVKGGYLLKNTATQAVVFLALSQFKHLKSLIDNNQDIDEAVLEVLCGEQMIVVPNNVDEVSDYIKSFTEIRDVGTKTFTLHFVPTIMCQLSCAYCFENGTNRKGMMEQDVLDATIVWLDSYFSTHTLERFKVVLFGGEPLLGRKIIEKAMPKFFTLAKKYELRFSTELVSNGELLTNKFAKFLKAYSWNRVQITLDGPKEVHDSIRFGKNGRPTFDVILNNIKMVLQNDYIKKADVRINYSLLTAKYVSEVLEVLADTGFQNRIEISFGMIMPTESNQFELTFESEKRMSDAYVEFCTSSKKLGFITPTEFSAGPWCVAVEKHSAVLQPNGSLQKCISTVGRNKFDFSTVRIISTEYAKDARFEHFKRQQECIDERCSYLPICGGGCPWDSMVAHGDIGFEMRFCRKNVLDIINRELLVLQHGKR